MSIEHRSPKITDLFSIVILDQRVRGHTARTIGTYEERLGRFFVWLSDACIETVDQVTPTIIRTYLYSMQERALSSYTVYGAARAIRAFFHLRSGRTVGGFARLQNRGKWS